MAEHTPDREGVIVRLGEIIPAKVARMLGEEALRLGEEYSRASRLFSSIKVLNIHKAPSLGQSIVRPNINEVKLDTVRYEVVTGVHDFLSDLITIGGGESEQPGSDFFIGAAGGGMWHVDGSRDWRMLVNLSRFPISLKVGNPRSGVDWTDFGRPRCGYEADVPWSNETLIYEPGEGVLLDNVCSSKLQVPHVGSVEPGKVFLRTIADAKIES